MSIGARVKRGQMGGIYHHILYHLDYIPYYTVYYTILECKLGQMPAPPNYPFKEPQIPSNRDYKALHRGTLGRLGGCQGFGDFYLLLQVHGCGVPIHHSSPTPPRRRHITVAWRFRTVELSFPASQGSSARSSSSVVGAVVK